MTGGGFAGRIKVAPGAEGIERLEAHFLGRPFSPHRHDTYAIGITIAGVQTFRYRGETWQCLPGQCHILHPDEMHDGSAGTAAGFVYRMVYIDPGLIRQPLDGKSLPFVRHPVVDMTRVLGCHRFDIWDLDAPFDDVQRIELVTALVDLLVAAADGAGNTGRLAIARLLRIREMIALHPEQQYSMTELEDLSGLDRWTIARQFRLAFGTSPSRFRTMRQLDRVRCLLKRGGALADAALEAGFADQSHMLRCFKRAHGLTPGAWAAAVAR